MSADTSPLNPGQRAIVGGSVVQAKNRGKNVSCSAHTTKKRACRRSAAIVYHRTCIEVRERDPRTRFGQVQRSAHQSNTRLARRRGSLTWNQMIQFCDKEDKDVASKRQTAECSHDVRRKG